MADETNQPIVTKKPKGRSPSYPGVSLETAIDRARALYRETGTHPLPLGDITTKWGYKSPTSGPASVTYSAVKKYGLLEEAGSGDTRSAWVSPLGVKILNPNPEQAAAIREAALTPSIIREWWGTYGLDKVPTWDSLKWQLVVNGPWTESGLREFLKIYRETVAFADLASSGPVKDEGAADPGGNNDGDGAEHGEDQKPRNERLRQPQATVMKTYAIPVDASHDAMIELPVPMTPARWANFQKFLSAMEGIIVQPESELPAPLMSEINPDEIR